MASVLPIDPQVVEFVDVVGGIMFRSILLPERGMRVPQHKHDVSHPTFCGQGAAHYYVDGELRGIITAGHAVQIEAGRAHEFVALQDATRLTCVFNAEQALLLKEKGF